MNAISFRLIAWGIFQLICLDLFSQKLLEGMVLSDSGVPLKGVSVYTHLTKRSVSTDEYGVFNIALTDQDSVLYITHVGYETLSFELVFIPDPLVVKLHAKETYLDEVVVSSGYQTFPKERSTGSFTQISNERFNEQVGTDIVSRLPAIANSLTKDNSTTSGGLMIRGLSTIRGPKGPLIVVDNFPYEGDIDNINPNDVSNITILKDAAAASVWGARAGNGVVVITTKRGSFGNPLTIEASMNMAVGSKPNLSYIPQISSADFIAVEEFLYQEGYYESDINSLSKNALSPVVELLLSYGGDKAAPQYRQEVDRLLGVDVRDDFARYIYSRSAERQYALGIRGGTQSHAWSASFGHDQNTSATDARYTRTNLRFQNKYRLTERLELEGEVYYTQSKSRSGKPGYGDIGVISKSLYPYAQLAGPDGSPLTVAQRRQGYIDTAGRGRLLDWNYYPLEDYRHMSNQTRINDMVLNTGTAYRIAGGLSLSLKYQYRFQQTSGENLRNEQSYFARNLVNTYTQLNAETGEIIHAVPTGGVLDYSIFPLKSHNLRGQVSYETSHDSHDLNLIAGGELRSMTTSGYRHRVYGYNPDILTFSPVDFTREYEQFHNGNMSYIPSADDIVSQTNRFVSIYANGAYTYNDRYTVSASVRRDASNIFGLRANDKWNPLWSIGTSWEMSNENFWKNKWLPYFRVRSTYGYSGNVDPSMSAFTTIFYAGNSLYMPGEVYARFDNYYNPDLQWEVLRMLNYGVDFKLEGGRLFGSIEFYNKWGDNLYGYSPIDETAGVGQVMLKNTARIEGRGFDVELNSVNVQRNGFVWTSNLNFSRNADRVVEYYLTNNNATSFVGSSLAAISPKEGTPVYSIFSLQWAGLDPTNGNPLGYADGNITDNYAVLTGSSATVDDLEYHGPALPVYFGSLGNTFTFGKVSLTLRLTFKAGHFFRRESINYNLLYSNWRGHADYSARWKQPGDELITTVPSRVYPNNPARDNFYSRSSVLVEKADHVRLQYVNFSYTLSQKNIGTLSVKNLSFYLAANNLGVIWRANKLGLDPDFHGFNVIPPSPHFSIGFRTSI